jgi:bis(5'-nucleosyl)-tetraphosphatase (symmetrical)
MHVDRTLGFAMVHAGFAPKWTIKIAEARAREAEEQLRGDGYRKLLKNMYGDKPVWNPKLTGADRFRAIVNIFTRMRYCTPNGRIGFEEKGRPARRSRACTRGSTCPGTRRASCRWCAGTGRRWACSWAWASTASTPVRCRGGKLTALELGPELRLHQVAGREVPPSEIRRAG